MGPRMPVKSERVTLTGDYGEFWFVFRKNLRAGDIDALMAAGESRNRAAMREAFARILLDWNLCDEEGNPFPSPKGNPAAFENVPEELLGDMLAKALEVLTRPPLPTNND